MKYTLTEEYNIVEAMPDSWTRGLEQPGQTADGLSIVVDTCFKFQTMQGIGAAFSEIGSKAIFSLDPEQREKLMADLFSKEGAGFTYCRLPVGASDFALDAYSFSEVPDDYEMKYFDLSRDEKCMIPFIKEAMKHNPGLKIHASPWAPPAWMKENGLMTAGGSLRDEEGVYKAYAKYFVEFIKGYERNGITIDRIIIQNETDALSNYTSCLMEPWQLIKFITKYLFPAMQEAGVRTELWAGTFRTFLDCPSHFCAKDDDFMACVKGFAFQYSVPDQIIAFRQLFPHIPIMHTESLCHDSRNNETQAASLFMDFIQYMNFGCEVYSYWNMILDERSMSSWGWRQNSLIKIITNEKRVIYNPDYHVMRMLSSAIRPGYIRVNALCSSRHVTAFTSPCGSEVLVLIPNLIDEVTNLKLRVDRDTHLKTTLEPNTLNIVRLKKNGEGYVIAES